MSLGITAAGWLAIGTTVVSTAANMHQGNMAAKSQKSAQLDAERAAKKQELDAQQEFNRLNKKKADPLALLEQARLSGKVGGASTMLTGAQGAGTGQLGASTLLGA